MTNSSSKLIAVKSPGSKRATETLGIEPGTTVLDVLNTLKLGAGYQLSHSQRPEVVYHPSDVLYAMVEDGDLLYASALVDAGACPWLVIAQIGVVRETDDNEEMDTIVMAERATEAEAERESDRRNARKDGRWYFVMRADEYHQVR